MRPPLGEIIALGEGPMCFAMPGRMNKKLFYEEFKRQWGVEIDWDCAELTPVRWTWFLVHEEADPERPEHADADGPWYTEVAEGTPGALPFTAISDSDW